MRISKSRLVLFLITTFLVGCVDPFQIPVSDSSSNLLVVEGRIGNLETTIKLSRTSNLDSLVILPEWGGQVFLENETGSLSQLLNEVEAGLYSTVNALSIGEQYRIKIETRNHEVYQSAFSEMIETPPIESHKIEFDTSSQRLDIFISTQDPTNSTHYYRWDYEETYQYSSVFTSLIEFDDGVLKRRENQIMKCWKTDASNNILIGTSVALDQDIISDQPIANHVVNKNQKFNTAYSILVRQYALSFEEYNFWSLLEKNTESSGSLFDAQPSQLSSNLQCITNPSKNVVGYVGASSISQTRILIKRSELPNNIPLFRDRSCKPDTANFLPSEISDRFRNGFNIPLDYILSDFSGAIIGVRYARKSCADCRVQGGDTVKPDFWF